MNLHRPNTTTSRHEPERICALYSKGPHFVRMLQHLREEYPDEVLVAALPETYPFSVIETLADATIRLPDVDDGPLWSRVWRTVRRIRRARCSHIVVMFDSPRLNLLARFCGTGRRWCYTVDGRFYALSRSGPALIVTPAIQRVRGEWAYLRARIGTARTRRE